MSGFNHDSKKNCRGWRTFLKSGAVSVLVFLAAVTGVCGCSSSDTATQPGEESAAQNLEIDTKKSQEISIVMVGDMLLHTPILESGLQEDGSYNYDHLFAHTGDVIEAADIAIVNEEAILGGSELGLSGYPSFNAGFEVGDALVNAGFNVVCHANNHALDMGEAGLTNCFNFWKETYPDMQVLGIHDSEEDADELHVMEVGDTKIALLNYTEMLNSGTRPNDYDVDMLEEDKVVSDLKKAEEASDFVIVIPHWGEEYSMGISESQQKWAQIFLENGADLVIGSHPHVIEPVQWMEDVDGHPMLVYYSLGNYCSFTEGSGEGKGDRALGAMAQVTLTAEDGEVSISDYGVRPLVAQLEAGRGNPTVYFLDEYTEELADKSEMKVKDPTFSVDHLKELCRKVFGNLYQE